ncbi:hypothetical protein [Alkalicoccus urumqiensis]|uniref:Uncharacterized protein n=1 Tax=Alkalicoccus urumqiensis TaxID=1548213 RepID=A0A2P6MGN0_ALKUR|nr:hypothetical protein [Alkalicoccus urumqiensis]PRO65448.1 hypothetical protein C6I21_09830 [Alkalicoccus urumqiensis]
MNDSIHCAKGTASIKRFLPTCRNRRPSTPGKSERGENPCRVKRLKARAEPAYGWSRRAAVFCHAARAREAVLLVIEVLSSCITHSLEVPSPLPKKAKSGFRRQGFQDWPLVTRALPLFKLPPERVRLQVQAESGNLFYRPLYSFKIRWFLPGLF